MPFRYTSALINSSLSWSFNGVFGIGENPNAGMFIARRKRASVPPGQIHLVILRFLKNDNQMEIYEESIQ